VRWEIRVCRAQPEEEWGVFLGFIVRVSQSMRPLGLVMTLGEDGWGL